MKLYGIIGYPLAHSFSKKYFTEKFLLEGITDCRFDTYPIKNIDEFKEVLHQNPDLKGLNVTIPYKQQVMKFLTDIFHLPKGLTACNCLRISNSNIVGFNTDVIGFEQSLLHHLKSNHINALILGNGGAAEAVKFILQKLNINYKIVSRKIHDGSHITYDDLDEKILKENLLIINTTPLGTFPNVNEYPKMPYQYLTPDHFLYDLIYNPDKTAFLQKGEEQGTAIKNGYEMLVLQAEESWKIWNAI